MRRLSNNGGLIASGIWQTLYASGALKPFCMGAVNMRRYRWHYNKCGKNKRCELCKQQILKGQNQMYMNTWSGKRYYQHANCPILSRPLKNKEAAPPDVQQPQPKICPSCRGYDGIVDKYGNVEKRHCALCNGTGKLSGMRRTLAEIRPL
jgi:hypothetical protein